MLEDEWAANVSFKPTVRVVVVGVYHFDAEAEEEAVEEGIG